MTNYTNTDFGLESNLLGIFNGLNELTGGWFIGLLLIFLFFIILSINYSNHRDLGASVMSAAFVNFIVSVLFWALNLIDLYIVVIPMVILIGSVLMRLIGNK